MTIIYFILILGITVLFHEFGHYIWAKKNNVYVYEFSIGMGPRLLKWTGKNKETEYSLRLLPIGGYVALAGEEYERNDKVPNGRYLQDQSFLKNLIIMAAGVINNFILALFLLFIVGLFTGYTNPKPVIDSVVDDGPAAIAGIEVGDKIVTINNHFVNNTDKLLLELSMADEYVTIGVDRNGESLEYLVQAEKTDEGYKLGFVLNQANETGVIGAFKYSISKFLSLFEQMIFIVVYLITGRLSIANLSGPVGIYVLVAKTAEAGILNLIYLMAYISLNVGIVNILPFPAFDGGRIFLLIMEKLRGKKLSMKVENTINTIGFILLLLLMIFVTMNDILNLL